MVPDDEVINNAVARFERIREGKTDDATHLEGIRDLIIRLDSTSLVKGPELEHIYDRTMQHLQVHAPKAAPTCATTDARKLGWSHIYQSCPP